MFTGIIEATASVRERSDSGLILERPKMFDDLKIGSSIAVSGVCLTVTKFDDCSMHFDVVPITFQKSKLGSLKIGDNVNLERAMRAEGRLEGHIVQGHCEGVGEGLGLGLGLGDGEGAMLTIKIPDYLLPFIVRSGSITLDGVALTIASLEKNLVTVAIIPHSLEHTTLGSLKKNDPVNIETDILGRYVLQHS